MLACLYKDGKEKHMVASAKLVHDFEDVKGLSIIDQIAHHVGKRAFDSEIMHKTQSRWICDESRWTQGSTAHFSFVFCHFDHKTRLRKCARVSGPRSIIEFGLSIKGKNRNKRLPFAQVDVKKCHLTDPSDAAYFYLFDLTVSRHEYGTLTNKNFAGGKEQELHVVAAKCNAPMPGAL